MEAVFFLIPILIGVFLISVLWGRSVDEKWGRVGDQLGLRLTPGGAFGKRKLSGDYQGYRVLVETFNRGKQRFTRYQVHYPSLGLVGLRLKKEGFFSGLARMVGSQDIETGDSVFDQAVIVQGKSSRRITSFLTPVRRVRIHRLFASYPGCVIRDDRIELQRSKTESKPEELVSTIRRLVRFAGVLNEEQEDGSAFVRAVEAKRDGRLDEALESLQDESHADDVDARVVRGEILLAAGQPAAAAEILAQARKEAPGDVEVANLLDQAREAAAGTDRGSDAVPAGTPPPRAPAPGASATPALAGDEPPARPPRVREEPPRPTPPLPIERDAPAPAPPASASAAAPAPATVPLDEASVSAALFGASRLSSEINRIFAETYAGRRVRWSGKLYRVDGYYSDLVFGSGPGTKAVLEVHDLEHDGFGGRIVRAVVQLPEAAAEDLRHRCDELFEIEGELVHCDGFMRNLFLAGGSLRSLPGS